MMKLGAALTYFKTVTAKPEKWVLAALHVLSRVGFTFGIVVLAAFGWVNL